MPPALELRGIVKRFPGALANDGVDLAVEPGEIRALVGENGAGKTTLMRVAYGLYQPDAGEIRVDGRRQRFRSPLDAIAAGLGMVHQHFMLFPSLTVAENITFGAETTRRGFVDRRTAMERVAALADRHGLDVDPAARVGRLPVGVRQRVEILKMLYRGAEMLILDEPTAVLTPRERDALFAVLRGLAAAGRSVVFITHKLPEIFALAERATVMRDGRVTGTVDTARSTPEEVGRLMVGREVELQVDRPLARAGAPVLEVERLSVAAEDGREVVKRVSLTVRAGEIVGIAGAAGNGQSELVEAVVGLRAAAAGRITIGERDVTARPVAERRRNGLVYIAEDRDGTGLALGGSVADNLLMGVHDRPPVCRRGLLSPGAIRRHARALIDRFAVRPADPSEPAGNLSGGNRQKLVVARELSLPGRLLIAEQPTRGVDIAATGHIHHQLAGLCHQQRGVLLVSYELAELLALADRIVVMFEGRIVGEVPGNEASEERLGLLMAGGPGRREGLA